MSPYLSFSVSKSQCFGTDGIKKKGCKSSLLCESSFVISDFTITDHTQQYENGTPGKKKKYLNL